MNQTVKSAIFIAILMISVPALSCGQTVKTVSGTVEYFSPGNLSVEQAKAKAIDYAKVKLVADEFGTLVGSVVSTTISNAGGENVSSTFEVGESEVRGEWLETIGEPSIRMEIRNGKELVYIVSIKGRVRELKSDMTEIEARTLRNGGTQDSWCENFKTGDFMSIFFKSPLSGYMAVYLVGEDNLAQRLVPSGQNEGGSAAVIANKPYVFFSLQDASQENLELFTDKNIENNRLYVIFSTNDFAHPFDKINDTRFANGILPNYLAYDEFQSWLLRNRKRDSKMTVKTINFTIEGLKH